MSLIDAYLKGVAPAQRAELQRIRNIVRQTVPDAEETISYAVPSFSYKGKPLIYFASFKNHMSIFPTGEPTEVLKDKLTDYAVTKGTIRFTLDNPLPESLIKELLAVRLASIKKDW